MCFDCGSHLKTSSQQKHVLSTKAPWREYKRNCDLNNYDDDVAPYSQQMLSWLFMYQLNFTTFNVCAVHSS